MDLTAKYGARRAAQPNAMPASASPVLERVWDAVSMNAAVGTDRDTAVNDFDKAFPWCAVRTCNIAVENGKARVTAYEGEQGFARDGSNGSVAVEIPKFYSAPRFPGDGYEYWGVSGTKHEGWYLNPAFIGANGEELDRVFVAAYEFGDLNGVTVSASGLYPVVCKTLGQYREDAEKIGAAVYDFNTHTAIEELFITEFATLDSHSVMSGADNMPYSNLETDVITNEGMGNVLKFNPEYCAKFALGQTIGIGLKRGRNQITAARKVLRIDAEAGELEFDGSPLPINPGLFVYTQGWCCGCTDGVLTPSGSPMDNHTDRYPCRYRGIENLWGSLYDFVDGCYCLDGQVFLGTDPAKYADFPESYRKLDIAVPQDKGFPTVTGYDPTAPHIRLPIALGGERGAYTSDFVYGAPGKVTMRTGGHWGTPNAGGIMGYAPFSPDDYNGTAITSRMMWR